MASRKAGSTSMFAENFFKKISELRRCKENCDICLLVDNKKIYAHKVILAAASAYFRNSLRDHLSRSEENMIILQDVDYETVVALVEYMYTGKLDINAENLIDVKKVADLFEMNDVKELCATFTQSIADSK